MIRVYPRIAGPVLVLLMSAAPAGASSIVYNTFGPGDSYNIGEGWTASGPSSAVGDDLDPAMGFTPGNTYTLDSILLAARFVEGSPNELDVALMTDASGSSGVALESWVFTGLGSFGSANAPLSAASVLHPLLTSGTLYWLVADSPDTTTLDAWNISSPAINGPKAERINNGAWVATSTDQGAFEMDGTLATSSVPEPASLLLLGTGLVAVSRWRQRRTVA